MPRYVFSRASVVDELFTVDAEDLETAQQLVHDGAPEVKIQQGEWIDWYHDEYTLESEEDDLVTFLRTKERA